MAGLFSTPCDVEIETVDDLVFCRSTEQKPVHRDCGSSQLPPTPFFSTLSNPVVSCSLTLAAKRLTQTVAGHPGPLKRTDPTAVAMAFDSAARTGIVSERTS